MRQMRRIVLQLNLKRKPIPPLMIIHLTRKRWDRSEVPHREMYELLWERREGRSVRRGDLGGGLPVVEREADSDVFLVGEVAHEERAGEGQVG